VVKALFPNRRRSVDVVPPSGTRNVEAHNLYLKGNFIRREFFDNSWSMHWPCFRKLHNPIPLTRRHGPHFAIQRLDMDISGFPKRCFPWRCRRRYALSS
jgi:hypothetical protein